MNCFFKRAGMTALGLTLTLSPLVMASEPARRAAQETDFIDTVDVRVVNVEAVVTDRQGNRVFGLKPEDFRLRVDGREVDFDYFSEVRGGDLLRRVGESPDSGPVAGSADGTSYLVFVDDFFTLAADRDRVLRGMESQLAFIGPKDRMAVVAWNGTELEMLTSWTGSERELRNALRVAADRPALGLHRRAEGRTFGTGFASFQRSTSLGRTLDVQERSYLSLLESQLDNLVHAATSTLRGFAEPPGRKVLLMVSGGWPYSAVDFVAGNPFSPITEYPNRRTGARYRPLVDLANVLGYTVYPIDAPGLDTGAGPVDAARSFPASRNGFSRAFLREWDQETTLRVIAEETGGRALLDGLSRRSLSEVYEDTRSFYWLGFVPDRQGDDRVHRVELEVLLPGLEVRTRSGYTDISPSQEVAMAVESALLFGSPLGAESLEVSLGAAVPARRGKIEVPVSVRIPAEQLTLLPTGDDDFVARVQIRFAAKDERGNRSDIPSIPLEIRREQPPRAGEAIDFETTLTMRKRNQDLIVAVFDETSGALLSSSLAVHR